MRLLIMIMMLERDEVNYDDDVECDEVNTIMT